MSDASKVLRVLLPLPLQPVGLSGSTSALLFDFHDRLSFSDYLRTTFAQHFASKKSFSFILPSTVPGACNLSPAFSNFNYRFERFAICGMFLGAMQLVDHASVKRLRIHLSTKKNMMVRKNATRIPLKICHRPSHLAMIS